MQKAMSSDHARSSKACVDMVGSSFNAMHHNYFLKQRIVAQPIFSLRPSMGPRRSLHLHPCAGLAATDAAFYVAEPRLARARSSRRSTCQNPGSHEDGWDGRLSGIRLVLRRERDESLFFWPDPAVSSDALASRCWPRE